MAHGSLWQTGRTYSGIRVTLPLLLAPPDISIHIEVIYLPAFQSRHAGIVFGLLGRIYDYSSLGTPHSVPSFIPLPTSGPRPRPMEVTRHRHSLVQPYRIVGRLEEIHKTENQAKLEYFSKFESVCIIYPYNTDSIIHMQFILYTVYKKIIRLKQASKEGRKAEQSRTEQKLQS
ncbi:hypothetical protein T310_7812 [Rasamsonia emersonii CBS 393.64]|uniref:Uncharacterized protein n=1 Tax=Rasamsonia emersonii (strain ATCC 16479 / CBS 393.64 / IMI 116815) TaxID=1408163 RepID=A0A0F4YK48_RASE3|nr:hypothetical protein T310_7812 [Rasamsonia emersonii CBS 393.64]KKA18236.1 hypothetical protein T310_7812 [Rasamsonia emersonii CBS 393.64]